MARLVPPKGRVNREEARAAMRRIRERLPASSVGIRSLSEEEADYLKAHPAPMWSTRQFRALRGDLAPKPSEIGPAEHDVQQLARPFAGDGVRRIPFLLAG